MKFHSPTRLAMFVLLGLVFFLGQTLTLSAQSKEEKKRDKYLQKARLYESVNDFVLAEDYYQRVLELDPGNYTALVHLGDINLTLDDYRDALRLYRKAIELDPNKGDTIYAKVGVLYKRLGNYRKSSENLQIFLKRHPFKAQFYQRALIELETNKMAEAALAQDPEFKLKNLDINSSADDLFPAPLDQRQEDKFLAFTSHRLWSKKKKKVDQTTGNPKDSDIYTAIVINDSLFGEIERMYKKLQTKHNDGNPTFTADGLTMYYSICDSRKNKGGCSIFESRYDPAKKRWGKPVFIESLAGQREMIVNSRGKTKKVPTDDLQPWISRDGRTIFFVSSRPGGEGGLDIWYSRRLGTSWSEPMNAGPQINTFFDDISPYLNETSDKLYFSTRGLGGFGAYDMFVSKGEVGNWGTARNLGYPLNSSYDDFAGVWLDNDSLVYFASDRPGGKGGDDIWMGRAIYVPPSRLDIAVKGLIRDKETKQPIEFATAILYEKLEDNSIVPLDTFETDQSARYEFPLVAEKDYIVLGNAPEYLANEEEVSTRGINKSAEIVRNIDIELEPIVINKPIVLQNIYYDFDEFYLRPDALIEMNNLIKVLNDNPNIIIQMGSHTDTNGTPAYNDGLSNNRARSAVRYLIDNGIDAQRLTWFGYGESQPLIFPEKTDEDEQYNRRTEFRITSIEFNQP